MIGHLRKTFALLCIFLDAVDAQAFTSQLFEAVQISGMPACSVDPPFVTLCAKSRAECSQRCLALSAGGCVGFNFKLGNSSCELFNELASNYTSVPNCTLYQVLYPVPGIVPCNRYWTL